MKSWIEYLWMILWDQFDSKQHTKSWPWILFQIPNTLMGSGCIRLKSLSENSFFNQKGALGQVIFVGFTAHIQTVVLIPNSIARILCITHKKRSNGRISLTKLWREIYYSYPKKTNKERKNNGINVSAWSSSFLQW